MKLNKGISCCLDLILIFGSMLIAVTGTVAGTSSDSVVFNPGVRIDSAPGGSSAGWGPLAMDGKGKIYSAWYDNRIHDYDIFFTRSTDWGKTWETDRQIGGIGSDTWAVYNSIAADENDHVYVVWEDLRSGYNVYLTRSTDGGVTFETEKQIDNGGFPKVAADNSGHVYISYHNDGQIFVDVSNNYGASFDVHKQISTSYPGRIADIAADGSGNAYVTYTNAPYSSNVYLTRSSDWGEAWETPVIIGSLGLPYPGEYWWLPAAIRVEGKNIYVAWPHHVGNDYWEVYLKRSTDYGNTFSEPVIVATNIYKGFEAPVAVDGNLVYVGWNNLSSGGGDYNAYAAISRDGGLTFSEPIRVDDGGSSNAMMIDRSLAACCGSVFATWMDGRNLDPYDIYFSSATIDKGITATIDVDPNTLNLKSKGEWVTTYIELPEDHDVKDINMSTIKLKPGEIPVDPTAPTTIGDYDSDGISDLMVKFSRANVVTNLAAGNKVNMTATGKLIDGTAFEGNDTIRVIE